MCVMEVRAGQHKATIAQAMAHNTQTVLSDLRMFAKVLQAKGENTDAVAETIASLEGCEEALLDIFATFAAEQTVEQHPSVVVGNERRFAEVVAVAREVAEEDRSLARKAETR